MSHHRRTGVPFAIVTLALALALGACGDREGTGGTGGGRASPGKTAPVANDLGRLVPADAVVLVYCPNPKALETKVKAVVAAVDPKQAESVRLEDVLAGVFGPNPHVDHQKPIAIAVSIPEGDRPEPAFTFIVGVRDAAAFQKAMPSGRGAPPVVIAGSFAAMSMVPEHRAGNVPAIAATVPAGDLGIRLDLAVLAQRFGPMLKEQLGAVAKNIATAETRPGQPDLKGLLDGLPALLDEFLASAEKLDVGLSIEGTHVDLAATFTAKAGSPWAGAQPADARLAELAAHLPEGMPVSVLLSMDWERLMTMVEPLMASATSSLSPEAKKAFEEQMRAARDMYSLLGREMAISMGAGEGGLSVVAIANAKDAKGYLARVDALWDSDLMKRMQEMGVRQSKGETRTVAGTEVRSYRFEFDLEKMQPAEARDALGPEGKQKLDRVFKEVFGPEGLVMRLAVVDSRIVMTMGGGEERMAKTIASLSAGKGKVPAALADAIAKAGGKPSFLVYADYRAILQQVMDVVRRAVPDSQSVPTVPAGGPVPLVLYGSGDGRVFRGGLSMDIGEMVKIAQAMIEPMARSRNR